MTYDRHSYIALVMYALGEHAQVLAGKLVTADARYVRRLRVLCHLPEPRQDALLRDF